MMDALNVDWCLTCSKQTLHGKPYCSRSCRLRAIECADAYAGEFSCISDDASSSSDVPREPPSRPQQLRPSGSSSRRYEHSTSSRIQLEQRSITRRSTVSYNPAQQQFVEAELTARSQWPGYNSEAGIRDWLRDVPTGCPSIEAPSVAPSMAPSFAKPQFPLSRQRPAVPTLCTEPSSTARTSLRSSSPVAFPSSRGKEVNEGSSFSTHSLYSALNETSARPEPIRARTKTQVRVEPVNKPTVLDGLARRFRAWGAGSGAPPRKLNYDAPAQIFMKTTTTTVPASPSASSSSSSPVQRLNPIRSNPKSNASGFTVRGTSEDNESSEQVRAGIYDLRVPLANARSPLTIGEDELEESLSADSKRGIWIAGREKAEKGWEQFGPAHYEKGWRDLTATENGAGEREMRNFEAWRARGRKAVRR